MTSRSGSVTPSIIPYIMKIYNISANEVINMLNKANGYLAICNSKDVKVIIDRSLVGNEKAILLRNMSNYDFKRYLMSIMANVDKFNAIITTGGIESKNKQQRELFLNNLSQIGIILDREKNNKVFDTESIISQDNSNIPIYVIPTDEEKEIANQYRKLLLKRGDKKNG